MGCEHLENLDLSNFNTTNLYNIKTMFKNCTNLESLAINNFDTRKCTSFFKTFEFCEKLNILINEQNKNCQNMIESLPEYVKIKYI